MGLIEITEFSRNGWADVASASERASWCCEKLEDAEILWFRGPWSEIGEDDRGFMCDIRQSTSQAAKNISYDSSTGRLEGYESSPSNTLKLQRLMGEFAGSISQLALKLLSPYREHLQTDLTSFRPIEEQGRMLPTRSRNDLIHVDAFPSRPAVGRRILRFFTNLHFSKSRVWATSESFERLANRMAHDAGLAQYAAGRSRILQRIRQVLIATSPLRRRPGVDSSRYDRFMLRFHDYLKMNAEFQASCPKQQFEFPPGSTWAAFTDAVPHAVVSGQCAVEQTFFLPVSAMLCPRKSPLRILEAIAGSSLV
jgi:3-deoxy-D-manno-oct-2-ulosonic acid (Kdo) hydroxylase